MFAADFAEGQAAADNFQANAVFFDIDAAEMGVGQAHVFAEFVIGFFAAANAGFLFGSRNGIPFFQIVQVFLQQNIAAAGIRLAFGNNGNIAYIVIALRIFRTVDKTVQAAVFIQAQAVFFSGYADAVAECA